IVQMRKWPGARSDSGKAALEVLHPARLPGHRRGGVVGDAVHRRRFLKRAPLGKERDEVREAAGERGAENQMVHRHAPRWNARTLPRQSPRSRGRGLPSSRLEGRVFQELPGREMTRYEKSDDGKVVEGRIVV